MIECKQREVEQSDLRANERFFEEQPYQRKIS